MNTHATNLNGAEVALRAVVAHVQRVGGIPCIDLSGVGLQLRPCGQADRESCCSACLESRRCLIPHPVTLDGLALHFGAWTMVVEKVVCLGALIVPEVERAFHHVPQHGVWHPGITVWRTISRQLVELVQRLAAGTACIQSCRTVYPNVGEQGAVRQTVRRNGEQRSVAPCKVVVTERDELVSRR